MNTAKMALYFELRFFLFSLSGGEVFEKIIDDSYELTEKEVIGYVQQVCQGLKFMHNKSIIHLDIKVSQPS